MWKDANSFFSDVFTAVLVVVAKKSGYLAVTERNRILFVFCFCFFAFCLSLTTGSSITSICSIRRQGIEDFMGDMDFKLAGSRQGITALQVGM